MIAENEDAQIQKIFQIAWEEANVYTKTKDKCYICNKSFHQTLSTNVPERMKYMKIFLNNLN